MAFEDPDRPGQPETPDPLLLGLEPGEARLLPGLQASEEVPKGLVEVAERLLRSAFGDLVHPGDSTLGRDSFLEPVEFPVERRGAGTLPGLFVILDLPAQPPVIRPSLRPGMLEELRPQDVVGIQLGLVGTEEQHLRLY